ncbi:MAG: thioredoxin family protein [Chloroflexi bacterium]|nr:thioredoxin family protein [Chloroflexota bacterium]
MAMVNPARVRAEVIEATEFPELVRRYQVRAVPRTVINDKIAFDGAVPERQFLAQVQRALEQETEQTR